MTAKARCQTDGISLISCPALYTIQGHHLTLEEKLAVAAKPKTGRGRNRRERAGLADEVELVVRMDVMITFNVSTDLDVASGARGNIVKIVLDAREEINSKSSQVMELHYPATYVLVRMILIGKWCASHNTAHKNFQRHDCQW